VEWDSLLGEREMIAVDHARRVDLTGNERACGVAFTADVVTVPRDADRGEILVRVAHGYGGDLDPGCGSEATGTHPRQRRVPSGMDPTRDQILDLAFVVGTEHVVEVEILLTEPPRKPSQMMTTLGS
jgi:hypothetical protein